MSNWFEAAPLFCPADRPERYEKAAARTTTVILDLEDAVAPDRKALARTSLIESPLDPALTIVRVNPVATAEFELDLAALAQTDYRRLMLAKTESVADLKRLARYEVVALCETAAGVVMAAEIARVDHVVGLMWGSEDLMASMGGRSSRHSDGRYRDVVRTARSNVLLASAAAGKAAIDAVYMDTTDDAGLLDESSDAAATGFSAKACIHPNQVEVVRAAFRPSESAVQWAQRVIAAAAEDQGVFLLDGQMIDGPLVKQAESIMRRSSSQ
ncbi:MAG: CoA ester lyase [Actinomycetes bacterium]